jgi:hypothetical protein
MNDSASKPERTLTVGSIAKVSVGRVRSCGPILHRQKHSHCECAQTTEVFQKQAPASGDEAARSLSVIASGRTLDVVFSSVDVHSLWLRAFAALVPSAVVDISAVSAAAAASPGPGLARFASR